MHAAPTFNQMIHGFRSVRIPNGALGAGVDIVVPVNEIWSPISIYFTLSCSAAAADRFLIVSIGDTPNYGFRLQDSHAITASQDRKINLFPAATPETPVGVNASWQFPIPPNCFVQYPYHIGLAGMSLDANDQFTAININIRTWMTL